MREVNPGRIAISAALLTAASISTADPLPPIPTPLGKQIQVQPPANYAKIDVKLSIATMKGLITGTTAEQDSLATKVLAHPDRYIPPVLYALAAVLFQEHRPDDALFWSAAGQIRARYDIARCADRSVEDVAEVLDDQYTDSTIRPYIAAHPDAYEKAADQALQWDKNTPFNYDCRWINLHGMGAFGVGPHELSRPESEWPACHLKARQEFANDERELLNQIRSPIQKHFLQSTAGSK